MSENNYISIKGARVNNLKNIDVDILVPSLLPPEEERKVKDSFSAS